jgi:hypothetical protein
MASVVKIKRSSLAGKSPTTSNITTGELALNLADGRLYSSNGTSVFEIGANTHSMTVGNGVFSIANGAITFPTRDGNNGQVLRTNGAGQLEFATVAGEGGLISSPAQFSEYKFTATEGQQSFTGTDDYGIELGYDAGNISVYLNGILQVANTDYEAANTTSVWFSEPVSNSDIVTIQSFDAISDFVSVEASMVGNSASQNTATTQTIADTFRTLDYRTGKFIVQISSTTNANQFQASEVLLTHNGSASFLTEYATVTTSGVIGTITSDISGNNVRLLVTPSIDDTEIKVVRLGMVV